MNKEMITLYSREGWAVSFKNKEAFISQYPYWIVWNRIGEHYDQLKVEINTYYDYKINKECVISERRQIISYDYIIRDYNGDPLLISDLPYSFKNKRKHPIINIDKGAPIPFSGRLRKRSWWRGSNNKTGKGFLKYCSGLEKEIETEDGVKIPPVRKKVSKSLKDRKLRYFYDTPYTDKTIKNWKEYRKNQWK